MITTETHATTNFNTSYDKAGTKPRRTSPMSKRQKAPRQALTASQAAAADRMAAALNRAGHAGLAIIVRRRPAKLGTTNG